MQSEVKLPAGTAYGVSTGNYAVDKYAVRNDTFQSVRSWAVSNGYSWPATISHVNLDGYEKCLMQRANGASAVCSRDLMDCACKSIGCSCLWTDPDDPLRFINTQQVTLAAQGMTGEYGAVASSGANLPVRCVSYIDAARWCNAKSERDGLRPYYKVSGAVFRSQGISDRSSLTGDATANGYRMPTWSEYRRAVADHYLNSASCFGTSIRSLAANIATFRDNAPSVFCGKGCFDSFPSPVGSRQANAYGLYDMVGNVWQHTLDDARGGSYLSGLSGSDEDFNVSSGDCFGWYYSSFSGTFYNTARGVYSGPSCDSPGDCCGSCYYPWGINELVADQYRNFSNIHGTVSEEREFRCLGGSENTPPDYAFSVGGYSCGNMRWAGPGLPTFAPVRDLDVWRHAHIGFRLYRSLFPPVITGTLVEVEIGKSFSYTFQGTYMGSGDTWTTGTLPSWVTRNGNTISGTANWSLLSSITLPHNYTFPLTATNADGTDTKNFTIRVKAPVTPHVQRVLFELPTRTVVATQSGSSTVGATYQIPLEEEWMYQPFKHLIPPYYIPVPFSVRAISYISSNIPVSGYTNDQPTPSTIRKLNHGLQNGDAIVFTLIQGGVGQIFGRLFRNYRFYVVNRTANTFNVSLVNPSQGAVPIYEITESYTNLTILRWSNLEEISQGILPWTYVSSDSTQARLFGSGTDNPRTVRYPGTTPISGVEQPAFAEPGYVTISASQGGIAGVFTSASAELSWGASPDDWLVGHELFLTVPGTINIGQELSFSAVSSRSLSPIIVGSQHPDIVDIINEGPNGEYNAATKIKGIRFGTTIIEANQAGTAIGDISAAYAYAIVTVKRFSQTITFNVPADTSSWEIGMEIPLTASASSGLPVTFYTENGDAAVFPNVNSGLLRIMNRGFVDLIARQVGDNYYEPVEARVQIGIKTLTQLISFEEFGPSFYGDPNFNIRAFATSGLPLSFTSSDPSVAFAINNVVQIVGVGSTQITASQPGDGLLWKAATPVTRLLQVFKGTPSITADIPSRMKVGDEFRVKISATASNGLPVILTVATESVGVIRIDLIDGEYFLTSLAETDDPAVIVATVFGNALWNTYGKEFLVGVSKLDQFISGELFMVRLFSDGYADLTLASSTRLPLTYSITSGPGTLNGSRVQFSNVGVIVVRASQAGNNDFKAAADVFVRIIVEKGIQQVFFSPLTPVVVGGARGLTATSSSGAPVSFYSSASSVVSISGNVATGVTQGAAFILAIAPETSQYQAAAAIQPLGVLASRTGCSGVSGAIKDEDSFDSKSSSAAYTGSSLALSNPILDVEVFNSSSGSSNTGVTGPAISRGLNDVENFDSRNPSANFTGIAFDMTGFLPGGDYDKAFASAAASPNFSGVSTPMPAGETDSSNYIASSTSPAFGGASVEARYNKLDEFEVYDASPPFPVNGYLLYLSNGSGYLLWKTTDIRNNSIDGKYSLL